LEQLEHRRLLSISSNPAFWPEQGPGPIERGAVSAAPNNTEVGAIEDVAVETTGPGTYIVYAGTANGGIWRSDNIKEGMFDGSVDPGLAEWQPLSDNEPSLSTSSMALDPNDPTGNTLWVGTGSLSSAGGGGPGGGLLKTTDGGNTWTVLGHSVFSGQNIFRVLPTTLIDTGSGPGHGGQIVLVATSQSGVFYSGDGGQTFQFVLAGKAEDIVADPNSPGTFYAALAGKGIYVSTDNGQTWPSSLPTSGLTDIPNSNDLKLAIAPGGSPTTLWVLAVGEVFDQTGAVVATPADLLRSQSTGNVISGFSLVASHFSGMVDASGTHIALAADSTDPNLAYVGTGGAPGVGTEVFRIKLSSNASIVVANIVGPTSPHADSRGLTFLNSTTLLETDDGGIYGLSGVQNVQEGSVSNPGWVSLSGDLNGLVGIRDTEFFSVAYDSLNGLILGGAQDNGVALQGAGQSVIWASALGGDGGNVGADPTTIDPNTSTNYTTLYMFGNRNLFRAVEGQTPVQVIPNGLSSTDQKLYQVRGDGSYPFTLNTHGTTNPEPMLFGMTSLYESIDEGNDLTNDSPPGMTGFVQSIAYGSSNSAAAAYFTTTSGKIFVRNNPGQTFASVPEPQALAIPRKIVMDPDDYHYAYVLDSNNNVWQLQMIDNGQPTTNGGTVGAVWQNITGNLSSAANVGGNISLQALEAYDPTPGGGPPGDAIPLVGGFGGVYQLIRFQSGQAAWSRYGGQLNGASFPNVLVNDLHYIPVPQNPQNSGDVLLAGTLGRGAWTAPQASLTLGKPDLVINADPGGPNVIRLVLDAANTNPPLLDVFQNNYTAIPNFQVLLPLANAIEVNSLGIQTTLIIDESNGVISSLVQFSGGSGSDTLVVNDQKDVSFENVILGTDQISGLGAGIFYSDVNYVQLSGGTAQDDFTLANTDPVVQTELDTGTGGNFVAVQQTAAAVTINCNGKDYVLAGDKNGLQDIQGALTVNGYLYQSSLVLSDLGDSSGLTFTVTDSTITNLAPATIQYSALAILNITTGAGQDGAIVRNTAPSIKVHGQSLFYTSTAIDTGPGGGLVAAVDGTQSPLTISGAIFVNVGNGTVQNILGKVVVDHAPGTSPVSLVVNDLIDSQAEQATLGKGSNSDYEISGLAPAAIAFGSDVDATVESFGPGGTFTVNDTPPGAFTTIQSIGTVDVLGTTGDLSVQGGTLVDVGLGNVQSINGQVSVSEPLFDFVDHVPLIVDDSADTTSRTVTTGQAFGSEYSITGLAPAAINYIAGNVQSVTIDAASVVGIGNSITVNGTPAGTSLTLSTGLENDNTTFVVPGIGGPVTLDTHVGDSTFLYDGPATDNSRVYTITSTSVTRTGGFSLTINYPAVPLFDEGFALFPGNPFNEAIDVQNTAPSTSWSLSAGSGQNIYNIGDPVQGLAGIEGQVSVNGNGQGTDTLNYLDQSATPGQILSYTVTASQLSRSGTATVTYGGVASVNVNAANAASNGFNTVYIETTASGTTYNFYSGSSGVTEYAVSNNSSLDGIQGTLNLHGQPFPGANDFAIVSDFLNPNVHTYTMTTGELQRDGMSPISYDGLSLWELFAGQGADAVNVESVGAGVSTVVAGTTANTVIVGTPTAGGGHTLQNILCSLLVAPTSSGGPTVLIDDSGNPSTAARTVTFDNKDPYGYRIHNLAPGDLYLRGGTGSSVTVKGDGGNETFAFQDLPPNIPMALDGGGGTNTLDYSQYVGDVAVDLPLGVATGLTGGISNIQNVTGSQGNDLIVGDANANVLTGGTGRNVLIGGAGPDTLDASGASSDNILIGGTTDFDTNLAALDAIFAEWTRTDLGFRDRFNDLTSGSSGALNKVNGVLILLTPTTVHADSSPDTLIGTNQTDPGTGKRAHNWFFFDFDDVLVNFLASSDHKTKVK
jgi:hypothetical protein